MSPLPDGPPESLPQRWRPIDTPPDMDDIFVKQMQMDHLVTEQQDSWTWSFPIGTPDAAIVRAYQFAAATFKQGVKHGRAEMVRDLNRLLTEGL
jgi:hypothetical protein